MPRAGVPALSTVARTFSVFHLPIAVQDPLEIILTDKIHMRIVCCMKQEHLVFILHLPLLAFKSVQERLIPNPLYLCNLELFHGCFKKVTYCDVLCILAIEFQKLQTNKQRCLNVTAETTKSMPYPHTCPPCATATTAVLSWDRPAHHLPYLASYEPACMCTVCSGQLMQCVA